MSASDPLAALREYVAAQSANSRLTNSHEEGALLNEAPVLLAHVERLEAALVELNLAKVDVLRSAGERSAISRWENAVEAANSLGREIKERKP